MLNLLLACRALLWVEFHIRLCEEAKQISLGREIVKNLAAEGVQSFQLLNIWLQRRAPWVIKM